MPVQKCTEKSSCIAKKTPKKPHLHSLWATFAFLLLKKKKPKKTFCT